MIFKTSAQHRYIIDAQTPITIKENTLYFPGWSLQSNYRSIPIYPGERGVINAMLPKGLQYIGLTYEDIPLYKTSKAISIGIIFSLVTFLSGSTLLEKIRKK